ncbi:PriCT-2 domain-containing protein [Halalkalicoccus salilacus]|uniref:PriCT-2 domain-containing protein n=1 Tax=Halalkalicoccus salilacus TaxID=3117459 RepID=UPI00300F4728
MWDADNSTPRRPHWRGDFTISWSDPDGWHTFEEARSAAQKRDSWGIGYVTAVDNDRAPDGCYGVIDIDGAVDENDRPKDWVPSLSPFVDRDAFAEWSPSHQEDGADSGLHIPLKNLEKPGWWTDQHFSDDDHEGVEVLTNKFVTVTGDTMKGSGDSIPETGEWVDAWLREAYKAITGDDPTGGDSDRGRSSSDYDGDEYLTEDDICDALMHIDPDVSYPLWRDVGFALADFFGDGDAEVALRLFKNWSKGGAKWDYDADEQAKRIVLEATEGGGRTIGTVIHHARNGGWAMPAPPHPADGSNAPQHPVYTVLDGDKGNVNLHLIPESGTDVAVEVHQNGQRVYKAVKDRGFWSNSTVRGNIAGDVAGKITGVDQEALRQGVKDALTDAALDDGSDDFETSLRTDLVRDIRRRTEAVVSFPTEADGTEYKVTLAADPNSPLPGEQTMTFDTGDITNQNPAALETAYLDAFQRMIKPDSAEWDNVKNYWVDNVDVRDREYDMQTESAVEGFESKVRNAKIWANGEWGGFDWGSWNGYHEPAFGSDQEDVVYIPGQVIAEWKRKDFPDVSLSHTLVERGILASVPVSRQVDPDGPRRMVWPIVADGIPAVEENALHYVDPEARPAEDGDDDGDERPEGLRDR